LDVWTVQALLEGANVKTIIIYTHTHVPNKALIGVVSPVDTL